MDTLSYFLRGLPAGDPGQRRIHPLLRFAVLDRDRFTCHYCRGQATEVDHTEPWARGGETLPFNLVAACRPCNLAKGDRTPQEWRRDVAVARLKQTPRGARRQRLSRSGAARRAPRRRCGRAGRRGRRP